MIVHEYLRHLVIDSRLVSYEYFMDYITEWEIGLLMPMAISAHRTEWETARYISYNNAIISGNLKKSCAQKTMYDLFPLPFDKELPEYEHRYDITNEEIEEMKKRSAHVAEILYKKKDNKEQNG